MKKANIIIIILFIFLGAVLYLTAPRPVVHQQPDLPPQVISGVVVKNIPLTIELADTPMKRKQGLSGHDPLPENTGMFFIFDKPGRYAFWMHQMKFNLDILWINEGKVVDIWENAPAPPSPNATPASYQPRTDAQYVLEVTTGFVQKNQITIGDSVILDTSPGN